jgi:sugar phosphate isomerase/epimerase
VRFGAGVTYDDSPDVWNRAYFQGEWGMLVPGTGEIPVGEWRLLFDTLKEIDYKGAIVFEITPKPPLLTAKEAKAFVEKHLR